MAFTILPPCVGRPGVTPPPEAKQSFSPPRKPATWSRAGPCRPAAAVEGRPPRPRCVQPGAERHTRLWGGAGAALGRSDHIPQLRHRLVSYSKALISRCLGKPHSSPGEPEWDMPGGFNGSFVTAFQTKIISAPRRQLKVSII